MLIKKLALHCTALIVALGATSASAATEFPWPDLPVLYKVTRKAAASSVSAPKAASATRARDTEDQELINAGGSGCSWDEGLCSKDIGPSDGWNSFGSFEVSINTQLTKVELWGKSEQRQAAICSGMTCTIFGVPDDITMDPTNPGPLLARMGLSGRPANLLSKCVKAAVYSKEVDAGDFKATEAATVQLQGTPAPRGSLVDVLYRDGNVWRFDVYYQLIGERLYLQGGKKQDPLDSPCAN